MALCLAGRILLYEVRICWFQRLRNFTSVRIARFHNICVRIWCMSIQHFLIRGFSLLILTGLCHLRVMIGDLCLVCGWVLPFLFLKLCTSEEEYCPCSLVEVYQHFRGIHYCHLQGHRTNQTDWEINIWTVGRESSKMSVNLYRVFILEAY
jgi:hypothetical protein